VVLGFEVHAGQDCPRAHAAQEPDPRSAVAGADLDDGPGTDRGGEEAQRRAGQGGYRGGTAHPLGVAARGQQRLVFRDKIVEDFGNF
jgi:hypothetical protein